ncbi:MAG: hypothetical protein QW474_00305 [Candidatus Aenigmatarchaeota archaeon]
MRETYEKIARELTILFADIAFIGSFPLYDLSGRDGRLKHVDDLDLVVFSNDALEEILRYAKDRNGCWEQRQLNNERVTVGAIVTRIKKEAYPGIVYNLEFFVDDSKVGLCVFPDGIVNIIRVPEKTNVVNGYRIPDLGIYYITRLHPYAITERRIKNTALVINKRPEDPKDLAYISREVLREAVLTYELSEDALMKARNLGITRRDDRFREYMELTYDISYLTARTC